MAQAIIYKRIGESNPYQFNFADLLSEAGDSALNASTSTVTAKDSSGVAAASVVGTVSVVTSTILQAIIQAGTDKEDYTIPFKGVGATSGQSWIKVIEVRVRELISGNV